jgi:hypothetical protein
MRNQKIIRHRKFLVHAIAYCQNCDWYNEQYTTARELARRHHKKTGHEVDVELTYTLTYTYEERL